MTKQHTDILKGVLILQVIVLHVLSVYPELWWKQGDIISGVMVITDQLSRISIPMFLFLSWYGLSQKYQHSTFLPLVFIKDRILKLIPLYILWSIGISALMYLIPVWQYAPGLSIPTRLLFGQSDYHLYFVPLIIGLYLIYALVHYLPTKFKKLGIFFLMGITIWWYQHLPDHSLFNTILYPDQIRYIFPLTWLWYAWLGLILSSTDLIAKMQMKWIRISLGVLTLASFILMIRDATSFMAETGNVLMAMQFTKLSVVAYATSAILLILSTKDIWGKYSFHFLSKLGTYSFIIYLSHTLFIRLTFSLPYSPLTFREWVIGATGTAILLGLSEIYQRYS